MMNIIKDYNYLYSFIFYMYKYIYKNTNLFLININNYYQLKNTPPEKFSILKHTLEKLR